MGIIRQKLTDTKRAWQKESTGYLLFAAVAFAFGNLLFGVDTGSFGYVSILAAETSSIQALPAFLNDFAPAVGPTGPTFPTDIKSIMNSVVWPGKMYTDPVRLMIGLARSLSSLCARESDLRRQCTLLQSFNPSLWLFNSLQLPGKSSLEEESLHTLLSVLSRMLYQYTCPRSLHLVYEDSSLVS
jgi:hypothetical protein